MPPPDVKLAGSAPSSLQRFLLQNVHSPRTAWVVLFCGLLITLLAWGITSNTDLPLGDKRHLPTVIAAGGLVVTLLLFYLIYSLVLLQNRAEALAAERTRELRGAKAALEAKIAESEQLVDILTTTNEELSQFAYVASHDMKEPLRMITNFTSLLKEDYGNSLDDNARLYIQIACDSATRMQHLVNDLLEYARLDRESERLVRVDLRREFSYVCEDLQAAIEQAGATVTCDRDMPIIRGNPVRLQSLLQNLISNALKYHRSNTAPQVHFGVNDRIEHWEFYVRDNGIGIEPRYQQRIFQPFKRLHAADQYSGTGVGLAICRKIVHDMAGELRVESQPGVGSTFFFTLAKKPAGDPLAMTGDYRQREPEIFD